MEETAAALPDDLVLEVLARVGDVAALFRCGMSCKRWAGLTADGSFLRRRRWPEIKSHPSFLVGFFTMRRRLGSQQDVVDPKSPPVFIPAPHSVFGRGLRLASASAGLLHGAMPLLARRGLLLVHLAPFHSRGPLRLAVCDLLAGTCDVIPPLQYDHEWRPTSYCILTGDDCSSSDGKTPRSPAPVYSTFFKVLAIVIRDEYWGDLDYKLQMFSSAEPGWATPAKLAARDRFCPSVQLDAAVCHRGMAHWLCVDWFSDFPSNILTIDRSAEDGRLSLVEQSFPAIQPTPKTYHMAILWSTLVILPVYGRKRSPARDLNMDRRDTLAPYQGGTA